MGLGTLFRRDTRDGLTRIWNEIAGQDFDSHVYVILGALERQGPLRMSDVAEAAGLTKTYISRLVRRLLDLEMVEMGEPSADRRELIIRISGKGRQVLDSWRMAARRTLVKFLADWTDDERLAFADLLARFAEDVEKAISTDVKSNSPRLEVQEVFVTGKEGES